MPGRVVVLAACALVAACSRGGPLFALPDRDAPEVQQEEARVAAVLAADPSGWLLGQAAGVPASCSVRLLRKVDQVDYVYARCTADQAGFSSPLKVAGSVVTRPGDGSEYAPSLSRIFPPDIAAALNADPRRYAP